MSSVESLFLIVAIFAATTGAATLVALYFSDVVEWVRRLWRRRQI